MSGILTRPFAYLPPKFLGNENRRKWKERRADQPGEERRADQLWKDLPRRQNGTIITGSLVEGYGGNVTSAVVGATDGAGIYMASLPAEIWREIIHLATDTYPAPLSIRDPSATPAVDLPMQEQYRLYRQSIASKLSVSRVCTTWKEVAKPFLFEWIWITSFRQADALGRLIQNEEKVGVVPTNTRSSAWWIRKIWLDADFPGSITKPLDVDWGLLRVISKCPRLRHYRHTSPLNRRPRLFSLTLFEIIGDSYSESTKRDYWPGSPVVTAGDENLMYFGRNIEPPEYPRHLVSLDWSDIYPRSLIATFEKYSFPLSCSISTTLQNLTIRTSSTEPWSHFPTNERRFQWDQIIKSAPLSLPVLRSLKVIGLRGLGGLDAWNLPTLQRLSLCGDGQNAGKHLRPFLSKHGANIRELEVLSPLDFGPEINPGDESQWGPVDLSKTCQNLENIQLPANGLDRWPLNQTLLRQGTSPLSVKRLSLVETESIVFRGTVCYHLNRLVEIKREELPLLEVVQDMSFESGGVRQRALRLPESPETRPHVDFWKAMEVILREEGVRLMDWSGAYLSMCQ